MKFKSINYNIVALIVILVISCNENKINDDKIIMEMIENQITTSAKTHALDNNDNFSPDGKELCYDTRATVYNTNLANCKSIEKVNIETGEETVLWEPKSVTGENAAPGVAAVSYHPSINKVIFIHGPFLEEVDKRGYYGIKNRTAVEVDGISKKLSKVEMRDISNKETIPGAHRGGTHRHEYTKNGNRIGFTYDDILVQNYERTIGYMEKNENAPEGYPFYFSVILKPAEKGKSKPGEIEKANDDAWIDSSGTMRAFIGKVRSANGVDYSTDLFVADIPLNVDITTSYSGNAKEYPRAPNGISIKRLTQGFSAKGIVRGSNDGKKIAFSALDNKEVNQVFVIDAKGSDNAVKISNESSDVSNVRWHPSNNWIFYIANGNIFITNIDQNKTIQLTNSVKERGDLVVAQDGNRIAYVAPVETRDIETKLVKDATGNDFRQIFVMELDWDKILSKY